MSSELIGIIMAMISLSGAAVTGQRVMRSEVVETGHGTVA